MKSELQQLQVFRVSPFCLHQPADEHYYPYVHVASTWSIHCYFCNLCINNSSQPRQTTSVFTYVNYPGPSASVPLRLLHHSYSSLKSFVFEALRNKETFSYFALNHFYLASCISSFVLNISLILLLFTSPSIKPNHSLVFFQRAGKVEVGIFGKLLI